MKTWTVLVGFVLTAPLWADEYYVSATRGKGKQGSKADPVADLGVLAAQLKAR